jgi:outer membrane protein assembly factor BamB
MVNCFARSAAISRLVIVFLGISTLPASILAEDWPQWMGTERNGVWKEKGIISSFSSTGPKVLWRQPIHGGYAGPAVANGRVYVMDYVTDGDQTPDPGKRNELKGTERVLCFDAKTGKQLWKYEYECNYGISYPAGPRCTPTVDGNRVYTLGAEGDLLCLDAKSGSVNWSKSFKTDFKAPTPIWGFCSHPLIDGDTLYCLVGGEGSAVVAFDKTTGAEKWKSLSAPDAGYAPPSLVKVKGKTQLAVFHPESVNGVDPKTGAHLWSAKIKSDYGMSIMSPLQVDDNLFVSAIGTHALMLKIPPGPIEDEPEIVWEGKAKTAAYAANTTPVVDGDTIYAVDCQESVLVAFDPKTGTRLWQQAGPVLGKGRGRHGTAFLVKNGERYFIMSETGELIIAKLSPEKYEEISRAKIIEPTDDCFGRLVNWSHPAFANRCVFARNGKEIVCVSLAAE